MARARKPKPADVVPIADAARCLCRHPKARHWRGGGGYSELCLHSQVTGELRLCLQYVPDPAAAAA